jgi:nucleoid-associated protein YgaU
MQVRARAVLAVLAGVALATVLWRLHPSTPAGPGNDGQIVRVVAWAAWAVAAYLVAGFLTSAAAVAIAGARGVRRRFLLSVPPLVRRTVAFAVGVGFAGAVLTPASALADPADRPDGTPVTPTIGALDWSRSSEPSAVVVVRAGDSLWRIAARALGPASPAAAVAATWPRWWRVNRPVVGPDPDVLHPGQQLQPPPQRSSS